MSGSAVAAVAADTEGGTRVAVHHRYLFVVHRPPSLRQDLEVSLPVPLHRLGEIAGAEDLRGLS